MTQASTTLLSPAAKTDLQEFIQDGPAVAMYELRWYVLETNATVLQETFSVSIEELPENQSIEVAFAKNGTSDSEYIPFSSFGSEGIQLVPISTGSYPFVGGTSLDKCVVLRVRNNGDSDLDMPEVRVSNSRLENPNGFSYVTAIASNTYLSDSSLNGDYTNNNVACWISSGRQRSIIGV